MESSVKKLTIFVLSFFILFINLSITNNLAYDIVDEAFYLRNNIQLEINEFQHNNAFLGTLLDPNNLDYERVRDVVIRNEELYIQLTNTVGEYNQLLSRYERKLSKEGFTYISKESIESLRSFDHDKDGSKSMLYEGLKKRIIREKEGDL